MSNAGTINALCLFGMQQMSKKSGLLVWSICIALVMSSCQKLSVLHFSILNYEKAESCGHGYQDAFLLMKLSKSELNIHASQWVLKDFCQLNLYPCVAAIVGEGKDTAKLYYSYKAQSMLHSKDTTSIWVAMENPLNKLSSIEQIELKMQQSFNGFVELLVKDTADGFKSLGKGYKLDYRYYFNDVNINRASQLYKKVMEGFSKDLTLDNGI